jgi:site-specific recombinase XerD
MAHPDFTDLRDSWHLALSADSYAPNTIASYTRALGQLAGWLPDTTAPADVTRADIRAWIVATREATSSGTARSWFAGIRHFFRFLVAEGEIDTDPTDGIRTPPPNEPVTQVLTVDEARSLVVTCTGTGFLTRRDRAIVLLFLDAGLRLAELSGLALEDVDIRDRTVTVAGKGSNRSGPRRRTVRVGVKTAQALDRYLRERRRHPYAGLPALWLGARNRATLSEDGVERMLQRRAEQAGLKGFHPHVFRHTWASTFRARGGSEGDLMVNGGWRSRQMLDRYGKANASERAQEANARLSLGDLL